MKLSGGGFWVTARIRLPALINPPPPHLPCKHHPLLALFPPIALIVNTLFVFISFVTLARLTCVCVCVFSPTRGHIIPTPKSHFRYRFLQEEK